MQRFQPVGFECQPAPLQRGAGRQVLQQGRGGGVVDRPRRVHPPGKARHIEYTEFGSRVTFNPTSNTPNLVVESLFTKILYY